MSGLHEHFESSIAGNREKNVYCGRSSQSFQEQAFSRKRLLKKNIRSDRIYLRTYVLSRQQVWRKRNLSAGLAWADICLNAHIL